MDIKLSQLSKELVVLREIQELTDRGIDATFTDLCISLNDKELASRRTVSRALDILEDAAQINYEWKQRPLDSRWNRVITVYKEAIPFAKMLLEKFPE